jgi:hypothetical protein
MLQRHTVHKLYSIILWLYIVALHRGAAEAPVCTMLQQGELRILDCDSRDDCATGLPVLAKQTMCMLQLIRGVVIRCAIFFHTCLSEYHPDNAETLHVVDVFAGAAIAPVMYE